MCIRSLILFLCCFPAFLTADAKDEFITVSTFAPQNREVTFWCYAPARYDANAGKNHRVLVYFGGRNTTGERDLTKPINFSHFYTCGKIGE